MEKILKNSIILLGPKGVGKTFFSKNLLNEKNTPNFVLSSDLLTNLIVFDMSGNWQILVEESELKEIGELYKSIFDFKKLYPLVETISKCYQTEEFSPKAKKVAMSYWKARLLEDATQMLKKPYILDAGADFGAVIDLSDTEKLYLAQLFYMPSDIVETRMASFIEKFGTRIALKPEETSKPKVERFNDEDNKIFTENKNSYSKFATIIVDCKDIYNTNEPKEIAVKKVTTQISSNIKPSTFGD